jgi:NADPH-dependent F420 reductase
LSDASRTTTFSVLGGTGALGAAIAARLAAAGRRVVIGSRDPQKAAAFAAQLKTQVAAADVSGAELAAAAAAGDLVILTVPYAAHADTLARVRQALQGKIMVDATAPLRPPSSCRRPAAPRSMQPPSLAKACASSQRCRQSGRRNSPPASPSTPTCW